MKRYLLWICALVCASCRTAPETTGFLAAATGKTWLPGDGATGIVVTSILVQEKGKTITLGVTENGRDITYDFKYDSENNSSQAYYKNTVRPVTGVMITRFIGIKIANGKLYWENHKPQPGPADFPIGTTQEEWDAFNTQWWAKEKVTFDSDYAMIGK